MMDMVNVCESKPDWPQERFHLISVMKKKSQGITDIIQRPRHLPLRQAGGGLMRLCNEAVWVAVSLMAASQPQKSSSSQPCWYLGQRHVAVALKEICRPRGKLHCSEVSLFPGSIICPLSINSVSFKILRRPKNTNETVVDMHYKCRAITLMNIV